MSAVEEVELLLPWNRTPTRRDAPCTVAQLLPSGFDQYLRLFHPFVPWDEEPGRSWEPLEVRATWKELAASAGVPFTATLTWRQLEPVLPVDGDGHRPWAVWDGQLEVGASNALFEVLADSGTGPYNFGFETSGAVRTDAHQHCAYRVNSLADLHHVLEAVRARGYTDAINAEFVWPDDLSWIVATDFDVSSTYVATDEVTAARLIARPDLETLPVRWTTRIDDHADESDL